MLTNSNKYKIIIVGSAGSGKSTYLNKLLGRKMIDQDGSHTKVTSLKKMTNYGIIRFMLWDVGTGLGKCSYVGSDGAILMYDATSEESRSQLPVYRKNILVFNKNKDNLINHIPLVRVAAKTDLLPTIVTESTVVTPSPEFTGSIIPTILISSKNNINLYDPLLVLERKLSGYDDLVFC